MNYIIQCDSPTGAVPAVWEIKGTIYTNGTYWFGVCKNTGGRWTLTELGTGLQAGTYRTRKEAKEKCKSGYFDEIIEKHRSRNINAYRVVKATYQRDDISDELKKTYKKIKHTWDFLEKEDENMSEKKTPLFVESTSKKTALYMQPWLYDKLKNKAELEGTTVGRCARMVFETAIVEGWQPAEIDRKAPAGYKLNPLYARGSMAKEISLHIQPGLYAKIKETAEARGISASEWMRRMIAEATKEKENTNNDDSTQDVAKVEQKYRSLKTDYDRLVRSVFFKLHGAECGCEFYRSLEQKNGNLESEENNEYNRALETYYQFKDVIRSSALLEEYKKYREEF